MGEIKMAGSPPVLFAACDENYFRMHAKGFCASGLAAGHKVHVMVSPLPGPDIEARVKVWSDEAIPNFVSSFNAEERTRLVLEPVVDKRAHAEIDDAEHVIFFQCLRYFQLPALLRKYRAPIVVLDIDSLVRAPIPVTADGDVGLFLRPNKKNWTTEEQRLGWQVLGAMVYAGPASVDFFDKVVDYIDRHERRPYIDQRALYEISKTETGARVFDISKLGWLDWRFGPGSLVWTAKGRQRKRNPKYIRERLRFEKRGWIASMLLVAAYQLRLLRT